MFKFKYSSAIILVRFSWQFTIVYLFLLFTTLYLSMATLHPWCLFPHSSGSPCMFFSVCGLLTEQELPWMASNWHELPSVFLWHPTSKAFSSKFRTHISVSGVLEGATRSSEAPRGGQGFAKSFNDHVILRRFPSLSLLPWKMSNCVLSRDRMKATSPSF